MKEEKKKTIATFYWEMMSMSLITDPTGQGRATVNFQREEVAKDFDLMADRDISVWPHAIVDAFDDDSVTFHIDGIDCQFKVSIDEELEVPIPGVGKLAFALTVFDVHLKEWTDIEAEYFDYDVPMSDWVKMWTEDDAEAAYRVAECMEGQHPELLDIVSDYMEIAADLGSEDAKAWLIDYHEAPESCWDPYV